jgi:hypothetical protein
VAAEGGQKAERRLEGLQVVGTAGVVAAVGADSAGTAIGLSAATELSGPARDRQLRRPQRIAGRREELRIETRQEAADLRDLFERGCLADGSHFLGPRELREIEAANIRLNDHVGRLDPDGIEAVVLDEQTAEERRRRDHFGFIGLNGVLAALASYVIVAADLRLVVLGSVFATWLASYVYRGAPVPVLASGFVFAVWTMLLHGWLNPRFAGKPSELKTE